MTFWITADVEDTLEQAASALYRVSNHQRPRASDRIRSDRHLYVGLSDSIIERTGPDRAARALVVYAATGRRSPF